MAVLSMPFTAVFGAAPEARVLDFLLESDAPDHTISEIARGANVARPTVYKVIGSFAGEGLMRETRTVGNMRFYALDTRSRAVKELARVAPFLRRRSA